MTGGQLDAVVSAINAMPTDASEVDDSELAGRMRELVRVRAMLDAALVDQLAVFDSRAAARYDGQTSTQAWLRSRLRLGGAGSQLLLTARQLDRLPHLGKALASGEITLEHAAAVAALAAQVGVDALADYEHILLDLARQVAPAKLRKACEHLRQLLDPEGDHDDAARQRRSRHLTAARTVGGMVHLQGLLDAPSGDVVLAALQAAMPVPAAHEERSPAQRRADGLVDVCAGWLASGEAPSSGGIRPQVQVTVSLDALRRRGPLGVDEHAAASKASVTSQAPATRPTADFSARAGHPGRRSGGLLGEVPVLSDGTVITVAEARRFACDAGVVPVVLGSRSEPLDIGRHSRVVPAGLRRALNLRDGGCRFAGCDRPASWTDAHHIRHWADGGETTMANCVLLCGHHHTLVHEGWRLVGDPAGAIHFLRPDGTRLDLSSAPRGQPFF